MAADRNRLARQGGEFMIQDTDHTVDGGLVGGRADGGSRQSEQSQPGGRQQGGSHHSSGQQGGERNRQKRRA